VALLLWLVVPGPSLKRASRAVPVGVPEAGPAPWVPKDPAGPFPVVGEVLPEAPVDEHGVLVFMRAMDTCEAVIQAGEEPPAKGAAAGGAEATPRVLDKHTLRVSEPWKLRVKGPFAVSLDNAGVVALEVAGRHIRHGRTVGEAWAGQFGPNGEWLVPKPSAPQGPSTAPETDSPDLAPE
jgi:hypothetical protein